MENICCICHEIMNTRLYSLPECSHSFHTNCILHWFRAGHNRCPLCNNRGVNALNTNTITLRDRFTALDQYKKIRAHSRKKNAPSSIKKKISAIKKLEEKIKNHSKETTEWRKQISVGLTNQQIITEYSRKRAKRWKLNRLLRGKKVVCGLSEEVVPIIIAKKITIT